MKIFEGSKIVLLYSTIGPLINGFMISWQEGFHALVCVSERFVIAERVNNNIERRLFLSYKWSEWTSLMDVLIGNGRAARRAASIGINAILGRQRNIQQLSNTAVSVGIALFEVMKGSSGDGHVTCSLLVKLSSPKF